MNRQELLYEIDRLVAIAMGTPRKEVRKIMHGLIDQLLGKYKQLIEKELENG